ncbi:period circadian protein homolog 2-like isoform X2 [Crotalus tigris]|uniref:period circadian protein homolog 2-like isoform X2 n=1 Tax=Crotalus tigris TaxID=88082 RepID=UPI00192F1FEA|nr:period circadian protein homolog 2-like isoform X2 [Crotalus tigris]
MSNYLKTANDKIIAETMDIQMENEQNLDILQEDIEMNGEMSTNDTNENDSSGHDYHSNEGEENDKETAMIMESFDYYKRSEQSSKSKTRKELIKTLQELKGYLPPHKKIKGKSSILATLKYALRSIKQIKANEEYYQLTMINENYLCDLDILSCTVEDVKNITAEYTMKNADMFAVAVSLATGKILYISDQAACILHCKKDLFKNAKFVELLAPQDVSVFYSSTIPYRLPSWSICNGVESANQEFMKEKSFFCRFSAGKANINGNHNHPFRMTPYLIKIQAPRIPSNKRIFTTIHSPSCLFQEVDERAVPLLGYLPQDLIGTPILLHLHPSDRPLMLTIHKKILQHGGQPFDYSPIRFCTRNGEYVTLDTSWSSFINPWSRKISFIIGRHKVRTSTLNKDVFAPQHTEEKMQHPNTEEITGQIHKLLLQPIYNSGSSGYGSLGSNGSHEHLRSVASSSDSNGNNEDTQKIQKRISSQNICKNESVDRNHAYFDSKLKLENQKKSYREKHTDYRDHTNSIAQLFENDGIGTACQRSLIAKESTWREQMIYSYQQINCLDNVIRYLESCCAADTVQKMTHPTPYTDVAYREKMNANTTKASTERGQSKTYIGPAVLETSDTSNASALMDAHLTSLTFPGQPESVISFVSQCSHSSTIVHVGDKKTQPELEIIEDNPSGIKSTENQTIVLHSNRSQKNKGKAIFKKLGLTKDSLAIHTQKEEWSFLNKCKEVKRFHIFKCACNCYFQKRPKGCPAEHDMCGLHHDPRIAFSLKKIGRIKKSKQKRHKQHDSSNSITSGTKPLHEFLLLSPNNAASSPSNHSQASYPTVPVSTVMPTIFPSTGITPAVPEVSLSCFNETQDFKKHCPLPLSEFVPPLMTPVVALVLPNHVCPQTNNSIPQTSCLEPPGFSVQSSSSSETLLTTPPSFAASNKFPPEVDFSAQPLCYNSLANSEKNPVVECQNKLSRSCTPESLGLQDQSSSMLYQSRCSSPLQLNLLQLEEMPKTLRNGSIAVEGNYGTLTDGEITNKQLSRDNKRKASCAVNTQMEIQNTDTLSLSTDLLDLLQEDTNSVTGSGSFALAAAESLESGSNGCDMSIYGAGCSETSQISKYIGSINSSENNHKTKCSQMEEEVQFIKCVIQDPLWLVMANADDTVMMTYQIPSRQLETVLKNDKLKLKQMQMFQPIFTEKQKRELLEVHPWIQKGELPQALANLVCINCEEGS